MGGAKFGQVECGKFLKRCETTEEAFAVLSAYCFAKYAKGSTSAQVARKIHLALCYFRGIRMHELLSRFNDAFVMVTYHVRQLDGHGLASCSANAPVATEAWNVARRVSAKNKKSARDWNSSASAQLSPVTSIVSGYTYSTGPAVSDFFEDGRTTWRYSEDTIAEDALSAPDYPLPPDLPSYNDASRETTQTAMTMSWLGH